MHDIDSFCFCETLPSLRSALPGQPLLAPTLIAPQQLLDPRVQPRLAFARPRRHDPLDKGHGLVKPPQEVQLLHGVGKVLRFGLGHQGADGEGDGGPDLEGG